MYVYQENHIKKGKGNLSFTDKHYIVHITFTKKSEA